MGVALAGRKRGSKYRVYVLMGDGECNEGSVWEAAMATVQFKLDNIIAIIDRNGFQQTGTNSEIMCVGNLADKWASFGWRVSEVNGHDVGRLYDALNQDMKNDQPQVIIAHTTKGKGFSMAENNNDWHHTVLSQSQYQSAIEELK